MSGALNALLAFGGNLFKSSSSVLVVINRASFREVPNSKLRSIFALAAIASHPKHDTDAALSNSTVHWLGCGGLAQPGGGSSSQIFIKSFVTWDPPAASHRHTSAAALAFVRAASASLSALRRRFLG